MATFFRVCHRDKMAPRGYHRGPYQYHGDEVLADARKAHSNFPGYATHPLFEDDVPLPDPNISRFLCGFASLDALYAWFGDITEALIAAGFVIRAFVVPDHEIFTGRFQSVCWIETVLEASSEILEWRKP